MLNVKAKSKTIAIIGAGPVGCYTAYLLAKQGYNVNLYEEHKQIGNPIQCTGLLTHDFDKFFPELKNKKSEFLINTLKSVTVKTKNQSILIPQTEYLVCRKRFDQFFATLAKEAGAKIHLQHSFKRKENYGLIIKDTKKNEEITITPDFTIAADGPLSKTAKAHGMFNGKRENYYGIQAIVEGRFNKDNFDVYFGSEFCKDFFVWVVPESSSKARVGLCSKKNSKATFDTFIKKHSEWEIKEMQAGVIPIYKHTQILRKKNCFLVGDAAGQVKATTLGGLIPGLRAAEKLVESIARNNSKNKKQNSRRLRYELLLHQKIRKTMDLFTDSDWETMLKLTGQKKVQKTLKKYSRDNPFPLIASMILKEPRYLQFTKHLFQNRG